MKYYLIGIKGCALTALANFLFESGHIVKGCDVETDFYTQSKLLSFDIDNINEVILDNNYYYIIGNAYTEHSLTKKIEELGYNYSFYPQFVSNYFRKHKQLCVCGSHGKTTSSSILKHLISECNYIIGDGTGGYFDNDLLVLESCEYKNTFLNYSPYISLILNIDYDHPDFFKTEEEYVESFKKLVKNSMMVIANGDDINVRKLKLDEIITYGMEECNDYVFKVIEYKDKTVVIINNKRFIIPLVGIHYVYDFVGSYLCCKSIGIDDETIKQKIKLFELPNRRLEEIIIEDIVYINDYAHHPTELNALYNTLIKKYNDYKLICFFQPHTISRSIALSEKFKGALSLFDECYIVKTFTSIREKYDKDKEDEIFVYWDFDRIDEKCLLNLKYQNKCVYIFAGAGDIDKIFKKIIKKIGKCVF